MAGKEILLLGNPLLRKSSLAVQEEELTNLSLWESDLKETLEEFRNLYGRGRAIAAPQIGLMKRVIYLAWPEPTLIVNPLLDRFSSDGVILWDDCMSFPRLLVKVRRARSCRLTFTTREGEGAVWNLEGDLSELLQHEVDHLNGILAVERALDRTSFAWGVPPD